MRRLYGRAGGLPDGGADRARAVLPRDRVGGHLRRHGDRPGRRRGARLASSSRGGPGPTPRCCSAPSWALGGLTKPTAWAAAVVLPFTLLLFDYASPLVRRRLLSVVRLRGAGASRWATRSPRSPASRRSTTSRSRTPNQRTLGRGRSTTSGRVLREQVVAAVGRPARLSHDPRAWCSRPSASSSAHDATALPPPSSGIWTVAVLVSALLLPSDRVSALLRGGDGAALGIRRDRRPRRLGCDRGRLVGQPAGADRVRPRRSRPWRLLPAARFDAEGARRPRARELPGPRSGAVRHREERADVGRAGGPAHRARRRALSRCTSTSGDGYPWGLDLRLNGATTRGARRFDGRQRRSRGAGARAVCDPRRRPGDTPPPGFRLILAHRTPRRRGRDAPLRADLERCPRSPGGRSTACRS